MNFVESIFNKIAKKVEAEVKVPCYSRSVEFVLMAAQKTPDFWMIVRYSGEPLVVVASIVRELENHGLIRFEGNKILLTKEGERILENLKIGFGNHVCKICLGKTVSWDLGEVTREFLKIVKDRPEAVKEYDQGYVNSETTLARIAFMDLRGDLRGKNLLILGDDDLVSIAAGLTGLPKHIAVVEIDERLTSFIKRVAEEYGFDVAVYTMDLRNPLPEELVGKFDTFQTDPPETLPALKLFIGRGIAALKGEKCAGYFGLTRIDASLDKWREFQKILVTEFKVVITDMIRDFNEYVNWGYIEEMRGWDLAPLKARPTGYWFTSTFYRIETLKGFKGFNEPMPGDIYYDEETASV
ncbi:MAG: bis-aminopropyl spermidine synthase family protein [Candidatus Njordarchaeales archaeon]